ncbi:unnamed protein product [Closterium sp. Naga37s-1]|nr:unnamed protein product [Closterium sp. Naga37s-1]
MTSSASAAAPAPPKLLADALHLLDAASRLITDVRSGVDVLIEGVVTAAEAGGEGWGGDEEGGGGAAEVMGEVERRMRGTVAQLQSVGTQLAQLGAWDAHGTPSPPAATAGGGDGTGGGEGKAAVGLHGDSNEGGEGVSRGGVSRKVVGGGGQAALVCADGMLVSYAWKRHIAAHAATTAATRTGRPPLSAHRFLFLASRCPPSNLMCRCSPAFPSHYHTMATPCIALPHHGHSMHRTTTPWPLHASHYHTMATPCIALPHHGHSMHRLQLLFFSSLSPSPPSPSAPVPPSPFPSLHLFPGTPPPTRVALAAFQRHRQRCFPALTAPPLTLAALAHHLAQRPTACRADAAAVGAGGGGSGGEGAARPTSAAAAPAQPAAHGSAATAAAAAAAVKVEGATVGGGEGAGGGGGEGQVQAAGGEGAAEGASVNTGASGEGTPATAADTPAAASEPGRDGMGPGLGRATPPAGLGVMGALGAVGLGRGRVGGLVRGLGAFGRMGGIGGSIGGSIGGMGAGAGGGVGGGNAMEADDLGGGDEMMMLGGDFGGEDMDVDGRGAGDGGDGAGAQAEEQGEAGGAEGGEMGSGERNEGQRPVSGAGEGGGEEGEGGGAEKAEGAGAKGGEGGSESKAGVGGVGVGVGGGEVSGRAGGARGEAMSGGGDVDAANVGGSGDGGGSGADAHVGAAGAKGVKRARGEGGGMEACSDPVLRAVLQRVRVACPSLHLALLRRSSWPTHLMAHTGTCAAAVHDGGGRAGRMEWGERYEGGENREREKGQVKQEQGEATEEAPPSRKALLELQAPPAQRRRRGQGGAQVVCPPGVIEARVLGAFRAVISLMPAGTSRVDGVAVFGTNEVGPHVHAWGQSHHMAFQLVTVSNLPCSDAVQRCRTSTASGAQAALCGFNASLRSSMQHSASARPSGMAALLPLPLPAALQVGSAGRQCR